MFTSTDLSRGYFPNRGVVYSILIHEIAFICLLYLPIANSLLAYATPAVRAIRAQEPDPPEVMWLPVLNDGGPDSSLPPARSEARHKEPAAAPATKEGLSYPGPQAVLSDFPKPTNFIQTLLEPALENPPVLKPPLLLPNFVMMDESRLVPPPPEPAPPADPKPVPPPVLKPVIPKPAAPPPVQHTVKPSDPVMPPAKPAAPPLASTPKMVMPELTPPVPEPNPPETPPAVEPPPPPKPLPKTEIPKKEPPKKDQPARAAVKAPPAKPPAPKAAARPEPPAKTLEALKERAETDLSQLTVRAADLQNILALTPMPAQQPTKPLPAPAGEALGSFAVSPKPNLTASTNEPGGKLETPPAGDGTERATPASAKVVINGNAGPKKEAGPGSVSGASPTAGHGAGAGTASGSGKGTGPKEGPFAGITVVGGVRETGTAANPSVPPPAPRRPLQTSFGVTVISTENSGGGLPAFGVFGQRQVYTVFLDMRETEVDPAPAWTLEFAVLQDSSGSSEAARNQTRNQQGLVLPFPAVKEQPALPAEVVRRNLGLMMIVHAVINTEGRMEQLSVKDSPDPLLNEPLVAALSKWVFRPARQDGALVRTIVLIGIPLWLPE